MATKIILKDGCKFYSSYGLLYNHCNVALGLFKDSTEFFKASINYLEKK